MRKLTQIEISMAAGARYQASIAGHGLDNGMKIAREVYKLFKAEKLRRKGLKK